MKIKHIVLASALLVSVVSFAQKDELKALKKIYDKETPSANDLQDFKNNLSKLEAIPTLDEGQKVYLNFYKSIIPQVELNSKGQAPTTSDIQRVFSADAISKMAKGYSEMLDYEKKTGKKVFTDDIIKDVELFKPMLVNAAIALGNAKNYKQSADIFKSIYLLDKKDQDKLYYASSYYVNANEYDKALECYSELKAIKYSGEGTIYWAVNKASKKEETFNSKNERDLFIKAGSHEKPRDEKVESKRGEIYKNIALIYVSQGKTNEAIAAVEEARKENPTDNSLILTQADLYLKLNDFANYTKLANEALDKEPNNADLVYNLGVISSNANKIEDAEKYYLKALKINPNYFEANLNLSELKLRSDEAIVKEMGKLGTSEKDNKRY